MTALRRLILSAAALAMFAGTANAQAVYPNRYVTRKDGALIDVVPNTTSAGSADAGAIIALDPSGLIDPSMLPSGSLPSGSANQVLATPNGSSGISALRALVPADLPLATTTAIGGVKVDGTSIVVDGAGKISAQVGIAPSVVQSVSQIPATGPITLPNPTTLGNYIVVYFFCINASGVPTVSDNRGDTYTAYADALHPITPTVRGGFAIAPITSAGSTTVSISTIGSHGGYMAFEFAGVTGIETSNPSNYATATSVSVGPITTTAVATLVLSYGASGITGGSTGAVSDGNAWSSLYVGDDGSGVAAGLFYKAEAAGSYSDSFSNASAGAMVGGMVGLKGTTASPSVSNVSVSVPARQTVVVTNPASAPNIAITDNTQSANTVFSGPCSGSPAAPTFRSQCPADLPLATGSAFGAVKPDGSSITVSGGVLSATGSLSNPMTSVGDVIVGGTSGTPTRVGAGTSGYVFTSNGPGAAPGWQSPTGGGGGTSNPFGITAPPLVSTLAWVNQGGATAADQSGGGFLLKAPASSGDNIRALVTSSYPSTPYTFTVGLSLDFVSANYAIGGIVLSDGTKFVTFDYGYSSGIQNQILYWTNATSVSSAPVNNAFGVYSPGLVWLQVKDDGTNLTFSISNNGVDFSTQVVATLGRTAFMTGGPTKVGVFIDPNNASHGMTSVFRSWTGI